MDSTESGHKTASEILGLMSISVCDGVPGVMRISSGRAGPIVGVTVCSHGNEPSGLAAVDYLLNTLKLPVNLLRGEVYLVVNNLQAALESKRFVSVDMNRLPADTPTRDNDPASEVRRSRELLPIWKKFDVGLDIHSTSQDAPPMIISLGPMFHAELVRGFPIEIVISNIDRVQRGKPAPAFYGIARRRRPSASRQGSTTSSRPENVLLRAQKRCCKTSVCFLERPSRPVASGNSVLSQVSSSPTRAIRWRVSSRT